MAAAASSSSAMALAADEPSTAPLFDDMFDVIKVNPEGKKFDKGEHAAPVPGGARRGRRPADRFASPPAA